MKKNYTFFHASNFEGVSMQVPYLDLTFEAFGFLPEKCNK